MPGLIVLDSVIRSLPERSTEYELCRILDAYFGKGSSAGTGSLLMPVLVGLPPMSNIVTLYFGRLLLTIMDLNFQHEQ